MTRVRIDKSGLGRDIYHGTLCERKQRIDRGYACMCGNDNACADDSAECF